MEDLEAAGFVGSVPDELITLWMASCESCLLPLDPREQWLSVGGTVIDFLGRYLKADGDKFWESYPV
jgi:hypothetical protein